MGVGKALRRVFLVATLFSLLMPPAVGAQPDELACGQLPGNRFCWVGRAFCDLATQGPERANGRGWDVFMLKRHHAAETNNTLYRTVQRTLQEAAALKKSGYRKIVLAGQSFGGYVTLEAVDTSPDIDAAIALAPGVRDLGATGRLDASITDRILSRAKVGRLALLFPKNDALFGNLVRGESADKILSRRTIPYLLLDETSGINGHGGGVTGRFALRYGPCLADFLAAPTLPPGRFVCPPVTDEWLLVRELLLPSAMNRPSFLREASAFRGHGNFGGTRRPRARAAPPHVPIDGDRWRRARRHSEGRRHPGGALQQIYGDSEARRRRHHHLDRVRWVTLGERPADSRPRGSVGPSELVLGRYLRWRARRGCRRGWPGGLPAAPRSRRLRTAPAPGP